MSRSWSRSVLSSFHNEALAVDLPTLSVGPLACDVAPTTFCLLPPSARSGPADAVGPACQ